MMITANSLKGYTLHSRDGDIGKVREFYFDDRHWTIRYLVADTGRWLTGRQVLISPYALLAVDPENQRIDIDLTRKQIEESPSLDSDRPVSRQFEESYFGHYGYPMYWIGPSVWGYYPRIVRDRDRWGASPEGAEPWDHHLRSTQAVGGHHIQAADGEIGHAEDFVIDDETWSIRYLVIDTRNWWPGKKVLIAPQWIERVSWDESKIFVKLHREAIRQSPEFTDAPQLTRDYELGLYRHYNRQGYWVEGSAAKKQSG